MKLKTLLIIKAIVCLCPGVPILLVPNFIYSIFGATLAAGGVFAAREYGASWDLDIFYFPKENLYRVINILTKYLIKFYSESEVFWEFIHMQHFKSSIVPVLYLNVRIKQRNLLMIK